MNFKNSLYEGGSDFEEHLDDNCRGGGPQVEWKRKRKRQKMSTILLPNINITVRNIYLINCRKLMCNIQYIYNAYNKIKQVIRVTHN